MGNWIVLKKRNISVLYALLSELTKEKDLNTRGFVRVHLLYIHTNKYIRII